MYKVNTVYGISKEEKLKLDNEKRKNLKRKYDSSLFSLWFYNLMIKFEMHCRKKYDKRINKDVNPPINIFDYEKYFSYVGKFVAGDDFFKADHNDNIHSIGRLFKRYLPVLKEYKFIFLFYFWYWFYNSNSFSLNDGGLEWVELSKCK